jgi:superkiller protein 3
MQGLWPVNASQNDRQKRSPAGASKDTSRAPGVGSLVGIVIVVAVGVVLFEWFKPRDTSRSPSADALGELTVDTNITGTPKVSQESTGQETLQGYQLDTPYPTDSAALQSDVRRIVEALTKRFPDLPDCLELKARMTDWLGDSVGARQLWQECLEKDPHFSHALYGLSRLAADDGNLESALSLAKRALAVDPGYFLARIKAAECLLRLGRPAEVVELLQKYLMTDPRSQGAYLLGQAFSQLQRYDEAVQAYQMAVRLYPEHAEAYSAMVTALMRQGKKAEARETLQKARKVRTEQADGRPSRRSPRHDLRLMFDNAAVLYADAGRIFAAHGMVREAEDALRRATIVSPTNAACRFGLASLLASQNQLSDAMGILEQVDVAHSESVEIWLQLAQAYGELAAWNRAEEAYQNACRIAPDRADVWTARADYHVRRMEDLTKAVEFARKAVELAPTASRYALLAAACDRAGDSAKALEAIDKAVDLAPESEVFREVQRELRAASKEP